MLGPLLPSRLSTDQRPGKSHVLVDDARAPPSMELPFLSGWFCIPYTRGALGRYTVRRLPKNKGNLRGWLSDLLHRSFIWESKSYDYMPYIQRQVKTATSQEQWAAWRCPVTLRHGPFADRALWVVFLGFLPSVYNPWVAIFI